MRCQFPCEICTEHFFGCPVRWRWRTSKLSDHGLPTHRAGNAHAASTSRSSASSSAVTSMRGIMDKLGNISSRSGHYIFFVLGQFIMVSQSSLVFWWVYIAMTMTGSCKKIKGQIVHLICGTHVGVSVILVSRTTEDRAARPRWPTAYLRWTSLLGAV